jgi:hypothetical protein
MGDRRTHFHRWIFTDLYNRISAIAFHFEIVCDNYKHRNDEEERYHRSCHQDTEDQEIFANSQSGEFAENSLQKT